MKLIAAHRQQTHIIQREAYWLFKYFQSLLFIHIFDIYTLYKLYIYVYVNVCTMIDANSHMNHLNSQPWVRGDKRNSNRNNNNNNKINVINKTEKHVYMQYTNIESIDVWILSYEIQQQISTSEHKRCRAHVELFIIFYFK